MPKHPEEEKENGNADNKGDEESFKVLIHPANKGLVGEFEFMFDVKVGIIIKGNEDKACNNTANAQEHEEEDVTV